MFAFPAALWTPSATEQFGPRRTGNFHSRSRAMISVSPQIANPLCSGLQQTQVPRGHLSGVRLTPEKGSPHVCSAPEERLGSWEEFSHSTVQKWGPQ